MPEVERHPRQSIGGLSGVALFLSLLLRFQPQLHQGGELAREPRSDRGGVLSGCSKGPQQIIILGGPGRASPHHFFTLSPSSSRRRMADYFVSTACLSTYGLVRPSNRDRFPLHAAVRDEHLGA